MSFDVIKNKLEQFDIKKYGENTYSESDVIAIESKYGFTLPLEYKNFLLEYGECAFNEDDIYCNSLEENPWVKDKLITVDLFYGLNNNDNSLVYNIEAYKEEFPQGRIPIASCPGGNEISLTIEGNSIGKVHFWDHESTNERDAFYLVAESFTDFIMRFSKQIKDKSFDDSGIESMEFKDGFFDD